MCEFIYLVIIFGLLLVVLFDVIVGDGNYNVIINVDNLDKFFEVYFG